MKRRATHLSQADFPAVPHLLEVPEERLVALLAGVAVQPLRGLVRESTQQVTVRRSDRNGPVTTTQLTGSGDVREKQKHDFSGIYNILAGACYVPGPGEVVT